MVAKIVIIGWTVLIGWSFFYGVVGVANLPPSGLGTELDGNIHAYVLIGSAIMHFLVWCVVAIPIYVLSRMFHKPDEPHIVYIQEPQRDEPALVGHQQTWRLAADPLRRPGQPRALIEG